MAKLILEQNMLIVIIIVICLVCSLASAGISTYLVNSGTHTNTGPQGELGEQGEKGDKGDTGATGATGQTGAMGTTGVNGTNGATWYSGVGAPSTSLGVTGDYYLNTATNDIYRKDVAGTWVKQTNLQLNNKAQYDSGWVNISSEAGQNITFTHNLNTTDLQIQIMGKDANGNIHQKYLGLESLTVQGWNRTYGETSSFVGFSVANTTDSGYIVAGASIKEIYDEESDLLLVKLNSYGYVDWHRSFDLQYADFAYSVIQTSDGGYAISGYTVSITEYKESVLLLKTDSQGTLEWYHTYGESDYSVGYSVIQTNDGGYAISGETDNQLYVIKTSATGSLQWNNTYNGEVGFQIIQTPDNGYAISGAVTDNETWASHAYLLKIDALGVMQWNKTYGAGEENEQYPFSLARTSDGGYALAGYAYNSTNWQAGFYLLKTTVDGTEQWSRTYYGDYDQYGYSMVQAADDGYAIAGFVYNSEDECNYLLLKTYANGTLAWSKTYSETNYDRARALTATGDGGYALFGYGIPESNIREPEYAVAFLVKTYSDGDVDWTQTFGGPNHEVAYKIIATNDGGYAVTGYTSSATSDYSNIYLLKTSPGGSMQWIQTYNCFNYSAIGRALIQTSDGGYAIAGTTSDDYAFLLKTYPNGTLQWCKTFGEDGSSNNAYSIRQTPDGGYALAGYSYTETSDFSSIILIKIDKNSNLQWNQTYSGSSDYYAESMVLTSDGGYAIAGSAYGDYSEDSLLLKANANGTLLWTRVYNSTGDNYCYDLAETADGGFALAGVYYTETSTTYSADVYVIKTVADGTMQWNQTYGTTDYEYGYSIIATGDGGFVIGGSLRSMTTRTYEGLLIKASSNGSLEWMKTYNAGNRLMVRSIAATNDGSYVLGGYTDAYDIYIAKSDMTSEIGLANVNITNNTITVYKGIDDSYYQYVRIQIWKAD